MTTLGPTAGNWGDADAADARILVPWSHRLMSILKDPGAATYSTYGTAAPTIFGSTSASADSSVGPFTTHVSAASSGATAGLNTAYTILRRDWTPVIRARVQTNSSGTTNLRHWVGLFSADPSASTTLGAIHGAAFGYDTGTDGTSYWRTVTSDGSAETRAATTVAWALSGVYSMRIEMDATEARFYVDGVHIATHTTNLPGATQLLGAQASVTALGAAARRILCSYMMILHT